MQLKSAKIIVYTIIMVAYGCASMMATMEYKQAYDQFHLKLLENGTHEYNSFLRLYRAYNARSENAISNFGLPDYLYPIRESSVYFAYANPERYVLTYPAGQQDVTKVDVPEDLRKCIADRTAKLIAQNMKCREDALKVKVGKREDHIALIRKEIDEVESNKRSAPNGIRVDEYLSNLRQVLMKRNVDSIDGIIQVLYRHNARYEILNSIIKIRCGLSPYNNNGRLDEANLAIEVSLVNNDVPLAKTLVTMKNNWRCMTFALLKGIELGKYEFVREMIASGLDYDYRAVYHSMILSKKYNDLVFVLIKDCYFDENYWESRDVKQQKAGDWYNEKQFWLHEYHFPQGSIEISFITDIIQNQEVFAHYIKIPLIKENFCRICLRGNTERAIRLCISGGNVDALKAILEQADYQFSYQDVQLAVGSGSLQCLQLFRDCGARLSDANAETIYRAAKLMDGRYFSALKDFGVNINILSEVGRYFDKHQVDTPCYGNAIVYAIRNNDMSVAKFLVDNGVDINSAEGDYKITPLAYAFDNGKYDVMRKLLGWGANPNFVFGKGRKAEGYSLMMLAVAGNKKEVVDMLLEHGARINEEKRSISDAEVFATGGNNIGVKLVTSQSISPLMSAIIARNESVALQLLEKGANINEKLSSENVCVSTNLIATSPYLSIALPPEIDALTVAIAYGMSDVARIMIEKGASIDGVDGAAPPIAWALCMGDFKTAELLVDKSAKLDFKVGGLTLESIDSAISIPRELRTKLKLK